MNTWKPNIEESKQHYVNWWSQRGIVLSMWEHFQEGVVPHAAVEAPEPPRDLHQRWFDPEWRSRFLDWYVSHSSLKADIMPVANTQLGPGSLAAILGGVFEGGEDTIWIHPNPEFSEDISFDPQHPNWLLHKELLQACKQRAKGHYYVGMPDLMEGLDVLAALKGTDAVLLDTVMQPELLEQQLKRLNEIYFQVYDELYDIIREGDEMAFCYFSSWAPGRMSKLQCDLSTMISCEDYRHFVQPFIREQCQKIDYTLYHLDGVGAMHHLDALLEIEELNAIQWTPGVGEPQGGSPKWYDLYRRILDGGKSVLASWVTLKELRPLLDEIGSDGVHLEMDFHNEREVEEALRIVDDFRHPVGDALPPKYALPDNRLLVLDGAMGTMIQQYHLREDDFRGARFASHGYDLCGCNDVLSLTCPVVVRDIHRKYLEAGADVIETNTFNAQRISMQDYGLQEHCREINLAAARLARQCADEYATAERPRFVAGSIGPTSRTTSMATTGEPLSREELLKAYEEQLSALAEGGVDLLLIETIFDVENARVAIEAANHVAPRLPVMLSFAVATADGHNMLGQSIISFLDDILDGNDAAERIISVGINCHQNVAEMTPLLKQLSRFGRRVSFYPNAGNPDNHGIYHKTPESLLADVWPLLEGHHLSLIGGCCGTTDKHIRMFAKAVQPLPDIFLSPLSKDSRYTQPLPSANNKTQLPHSASPTREESASVSQKLFEAIVSGDCEASVAATHAAIASGEAPQKLINEQMIRAMAEVGQRFQDGKAFVPQLLMAGRAMKSALTVLQPLLSGEGSAAVGKVVIGTVKGDLHDIGKNLVASMLEGCGFEVVNIGIDVSADAFIEEVRRSEPDILAMSALLTTTMGYMREVISALERAGIRDRVKIMVGGAPVTQGFADEIGADGYSDNANSAVTVAKQLLGKCSPAPKRISKQ